MDRKSDKAARKTNRRRNIIKRGQLGTCGKADRETGRETGHETDKQTDAAQDLVKHAGTQVKTNELEKTDRLT